jgi:hypothetical protein
VRSITLAIPENAAAKLAELARRDYRAPRQQAALMLVEAIEHAGKTPTRRMTNGRHEQSTR